ncbi:MAG: hypothetical protein WAT21_13480, partial [Saprospiraceae bacterium]
TDGITVWNKTHKIMENGINLFGHYSSTQSTLIVQKPGSDSLYFIFTTDAPDAPLPDTPNRGVCYSIVNINNNKGEGKVISKNITLLKALSTEKIAGVRHQNGKDVWIITPQYFTNKFNAYLLSDVGIDSIPIVSITLNKLISNDGCLKGSPNGDLIANANVLYSSIFKFDNVTGKLSDYLQLPIQSSYGVEFSPDQSKFFLQIPIDSKHVL